MQQFHKIYYYLDKCMNQENFTKFRDYSKNCSNLFVSKFTFMSEVLPNFKVF